MAKESRRAFIVARVSTTGKGQDPESQALALRQTAERLGWNVVDEMHAHNSAWDDGKAGAWEERILTRLTETGADTLMVWSVDRLSRRGPRHVLTLIDRLERHHGITLYSLQEPFLSTATADPSMRELLVSLFAWVARQESSRRSERIKAKVATKRARASAVGQRARWGKGSIATDADVERIVALRRDGESLRAIASKVGLGLGTVHRALSASPLPA